MPRPRLPLPEVRLLGPDGVGWLPRVQSGLEGHRRQPWPRLSQEPARRGDGYAERGSGTALFPPSECEEYRADYYARGRHGGGVPGAGVDRGRAPGANQGRGRRQQQSAAARLAPAYVAYPDQFAHVLIHRFGCS